MNEVNWQLIDMLDRCVCVRTAVYFETWGQTDLVSACSFLRFYEKGKA